MQLNKAFIVTSIATLLAGHALAHDGRRFDVQVIDGKLFAQGYISGHHPTDDGNGIVRDYYNAIHGHWATIGSLSLSTLPGFDIEDQSSLFGDALYLTVIGVKKWSNAPFEDFATGGGHGGHGGHAMTEPDHHTGIHPHFMAMPADEWIDVYFGSTLLTPGTAQQLDAAVGTSGHYDLRFDYLAGSPTLANAIAPTDAIYLVELQLSTSDSSIEASDTIHTILSPIRNGSHTLSLLTEEALGTPIPEPTSAILLGMAGLGLMARRRR